MVCCFILENPARAQSWSLLWTNRYSSAFVNGSDYANALAVGANGSVIVAGISYNGSNHDCAVVAYVSGGAALWTNRYHGPGGGTDGVNAAAVATNGDVIVTGYSASTNPTSYPSDYVTIKYSSAGVALWTNRYTSPGNVSDVAKALALDSTGDIYVCGLDVTIRYSSLGIPVWTNRYPNGTAVAIAVDANNDVVVAGYSLGSGGGSYDYATVKYSNAGLPLWTNIYNGPGNAADYPSAVVVDGNGDVVVTGYSPSAPGFNYDYATIKYSSAGLPLWTNRYEGIGTNADYATGLASDSAGNLFVTGRSVGTDQRFDFATIAYSSAGTSLWTNRYTATASSGDEATGLAVDDFGDVFVTGRSSTNGNSTGYDFVTIAYSPLGTPLQTNCSNGTGNNEDNASTVAVCPDGSVVVVGTSFGNGSGFDFLALKYTRNLPHTPIPLNYQFSNNQMVLYWTNVAFALQSAVYANGLYTNVPGAMSPYTNTATGDRQFFRLRAD